MRQGEGWEIALACGSLLMLVPPIWVLLASVSQSSSAPVGNLAEEYNSSRFSTVTAATQDTLRIGVPVTAGKPGKVSNVDPQRAQTWDVTTTGGTFAASNAEKCYESTIVDGSPSSKGTATGTIFAYMSASDGGVCGQPSPPATSEGLTAQWVEVFNANIQHVDSSSEVGVVEKTVKAIPYLIPSPEDIKIGVPGGYTPQVGGESSWLFNKTGASRLAYLDAGGVCTYVTMFAAYGDRPSQAVAQTAPGAASVEEGRCK